MTSVQFWNAWQSFKATCDRFDHWIPFAGVLAFVHYTPGLDWRIQAMLIVPTLPSAASETLDKLLARIFPAKP